MHPILDRFLDKWVWPTMPGAPGAEFRLRLTRRQHERRRTGGTYAINIPTRDAERGRVAVSGV